MGNEGTCGVTRLVNCRYLGTVPYFPVKLLFTVTISSSRGVLAMAPVDTGTATNREGSAELFIDVGSGS